MMEKTSFNEIAKEIHSGNVERGFYDEPVEFGTSLMLVVSELAEALEAARRGDETGKCDIEDYRRMSSRAGGFDRDAFRDLIKDSVEDEIADAIIRLFDIAGYMGMDLDFHIAEKLKYNATRGYRHGKRF